MTHLTELIWNDFSHQGNWYWARKVRLICKDFLTLLANKKSQGRLRLSRDYCAVQFTTTVVCPMNSLQLTEMRSTKGLLRMLCHTRTRLTWSHGGQKQGNVKHKGHPFCFVVVILQLFTMLACWRLQRLTAPSNSWLALYISTSWNVISRIAMCCCYVTKARKASRIT